MAHDLSRGPNFGSDVHHDFTQIVNAERGACPPSLVARPALRFPRSPPDKRTVIRENGEITPILRRCDRKLGFVAESHIFATFDAPLLRSRGSVMTSERPPSGNVVGSKLFS
jgi:hypothetical protein